MKCGCGSDYEVFNHGLGFSLRCKRWIMHKQNPNGVRA